MTKVPFIQFYNKMFKFFRKFQFKGMPGVKKKEQFMEFSVLFKDCFMLTLHLFQFLKPITFQIMHNFINNACDQSFYLYNRKKKLHFMV